MMKDSNMGNVFSIKGIKDFNADHIFDCGQCFRWDKEKDGSYTGVVGRHTVNIRVSEAVSGAVEPLKSDGVDSQWHHGQVELFIDNCTEEMFEDFWRDYLDLDRDYGAIKAILTENDEVMSEAVDYGYGIRLLHQDPWETVISFIISQNSNIPRIKKCINSLCEHFGENLGEYRGIQRFAFPSAERLASLTKEELAVCRLGYRDEYIIKTAQAVATDGGAALARAREMKFSEAEAYIRSLHGVGPKVANCILLFGILKYESFPLDVWMKRIMSQLYGFKENDIKGMVAYAAEHFGEFSGFAQQYLFYFARENLKK